MDTEKFLRDLRSASGEGPEKDRVMKESAEELSKLGSRPGKDRLSNIFSNQTESGQPRSKRIHGENSKERIGWLEGFEKEQDEYGEKHAGETGPDSPPGQKN